MSNNNFIAALPVVAVLALAGGCGTQPTTNPSSDARISNDAGHGEAGHHHDADGHAGHHHAELGPHGGHLIELGDEAYHAEILHDDNTHSVSVYLLDGKAENTVAIASPVITIDVKAGGDSQRFTLTAVDLGQGEGSFCFESIDKALCHALDEEDSQSVLSVDIEGQSFTGTFAHVHDHDHDHDHAGAAHNGRRR